MTASSRRCPSRSQLRPKQVQPEIRGLTVRSCGFALLGAVGSLVRPAATQTQWEVAPYVGLYRPSTILGSGDGSYPGSAPGVRDTVRHQSSVTVGARVTKWSPGRLGFEGSVGYAPSGLWSSLPYWGGPVYPAHVLTLGAKALLRVTPPDARVRLHVGGGVGLVGHGGLAYHSDSYSGPTTFFGGIATASGAVMLTGRLRLQFSAEDFSYAARLGPCGRTGPGYGGVCDVFGENAARTTGSRLQNDVVLSLGFAFPLASRNGSASTTARRSRSSPRCPVKILTSPLIELAPAAFTALREASASEMQRR